MLRSIQKTLQIAGILLSYTSNPFKVIRRPDMITLFKNPSQIVTVGTSGKNLKRGLESESIEPLSGHSIVTENGIIKDLIPNASSSKIFPDKTVNLTDQLVLPGLIDCHTHSAFAGSRSEEFLMRLKGATYEEIAQTGGGIIATMKAVRSSSFEDLIGFLRPRINYFISQGITTLEIKSGYGLSFYDEIKLLQVINYFKIYSRIDIVPTFLGAHFYPPEYKNDHKRYLDLITDELLPYVIENQLSDSCDIFCEKTAFSVEESDNILCRAKKLGFSIHVHSDQFNEIGGLDLALKYKALSVDHLEVIGEDGTAKLSKSDTVAVLLPGASFFLNQPYAPARKLLEGNLIVAIASDYNPGSSNIPNLQLVMQIAVLKMGMRVEEVISAVTINAAKALGINRKTGSIEIGKEADFAIFKAKEYQELFYNIGVNLNKYTVKKSEIIYESPEQL
jgi:imidazolonepropionase